MPPLAEGSRLSAREVLASQTIALEASDSETSFHIHEHLLQSLSPVLLAFCSGGWKEKTSRRYKFSVDVPEQVLLCFLTWAYYGDYHDGNDNKFASVEASNDDPFGILNHGFTTKNKMKKKKLSVPWKYEPKMPSEQPVEEQGKQKQDKSSEETDGGSTGALTPEVKLHPLLLHIKLYVFAEMYMIESFKTLSKQKLIDKLQELGNLAEGHERVAVFDVLTCAFSSNLPEQDPILHWLARYASWKLDELKQLPSSWDRLLAETGDTFAALLVRYVQRSSVDPFTIKNEDVVPHYPIPTHRRHY